MNICIPIDSEAVKGKIFKKDFSNPGVGGIEYLSVILAWYLALKFENSIIRIITKYQFSLCDKPENIEVINEDTGSIFDFEISASEFWILIESIARKQCHKKLKARANRIAIWSHHPSDWRVLAYRDLVDHLISTGDYQHHSNFRYFKHNHLINNLYFKQNTQNENLKTTTVCKKLKNPKYFNLMFLGALVPAKGFHHLLRCWNEIKSNIPNAYLHVIGGASLYGLTEDGSVNIPCEGAYARELMQIIKDKNVDMKDIKFYGSLGVERFEIYNKVDIAIINPTGISESFSFNLHECLDFGVPIIASDDYGLNDIMKYFPRFSISNPAQIVKKIVHAYNNRHSREVFKIISKSIIDGAECRNEKMATKWRSLAEGVLDDEIYHFNTRNRAKALFRSYIGRIKFIISRLKNGGSK